MAALSLRFTVSPNICSMTEEDGSIILDIKHDKIYSVIGVGSLIWSRLATSSRGVAPASIIDELSERYQDVSRHEIQADVSRLLESFRSKGIIVAGKSGYGESSITKTASRCMVLLARTVTNLLFALHLHTFTAILGIATVNLMLRIQGFHRLCEVVKGWPVSECSVAADATQQICEAVKKAASWYPRQSVCLQRSVVATCLLRQRGVAAELVIGCRKVPFGAHAWVAVNGEVANDKRQVQEFYRVLTRL